MQKNYKNNKNNILPILLGLIFLVSVLISCQTTPTKRKFIQNSNKNPNRLQANAAESGDFIENTGYQGGEKSNGVLLESLQVEGRAQILSGGEQNAYDKAVEHGLRQAVEQLIGSALVSETDILNSTLLEDRILAKSSGYVQRYRVLSTRKEGDVLFVALEAKVVIAELKDDVLSLQLFQRRLDLPRAAIFIESMSASANDYYAGAADTVRSVLEDTLIKKQFSLVKQDNLQKFLSDLRSPVEAQSDETINSFIEQTEAEFYIEGKLRIARNNLSKNEALQESDFVSATAFLNLKAFDAGTGKIFFSLNEKAAGIGLSKENAAFEAAKKMALKMAPMVSEKLLSYFDDKLNNSFEYRIDIRGLSGLERRRLKGRFNQRYFEGLELVADKGFKDGFQRFTVYYCGKISELLDALVSGSKFPFQLRLKEYQSSRALLIR